MFVKATDNCTNLQLGKCLSNVILQEFQVNHGVYAILLGEVHNQKYTTYNLLYSK